MKLPLDTDQRVRRTLETRQQPVLETRSKVPSAKSLHEGQIVIVSGVLYVRSGSKLYQVNLQEVI